MTHILFMNPKWGLDFLLVRKLEREKITYDYVTLFGHEDKKELKKATTLYKTHNVKSTPLLVVVDDDNVEVNRLSSTDEIIEYLKD
jgi:hypothetical protein